MVEEKKPPQEATTVEFKVSMHCKACERSVAKALSKVKGVETVATDMKNHKAIATGQIKPERALQKLKKKMGKRVEIVLMDQEDQDSNNNNEGDAGHVEQDKKVLFAPDLTLLEDLEQPIRWLNMFNDENPNACHVM